VAHTIAIQNCHPYVNITAVNSADHKNLIRLLFSFGAACQKRAYDKCATVSLIIIIKLKVGRFK
jgi:hypothetical protein